MSPSLSLLNVLIICILQPTLAITALPNEVNLAIPECASGCVQAYVADDLSFCSNTTDIDCLCRASSSNGYTLGEAALACMKVECSDQEYASYSPSVFAVCNSVLGAISATHSTITAPSAIPATVTYSNLLSTSVPITTEDATTTSQQPSTSTMSSTRASSTATSSATTSSASATSSVSFHTSIAPTTPSSVVPSPSDTATFAQSAAATSSGAAGPTPVLGTGQIAGIAVAGTVTAATALGLCIYILCGKKLRRQNKRRDSDASFGGSHIYPYDPESSGGGDSTSEVLPISTPLLPAPPRSAQNGPKQNQFLGLPVAPNQHRQSWLSRQFRGRDAGLAGTPNQIGVAKHLTPNAGGVSQDASPSSVASYRTTSNLLPEKPMYQPGGPTVHEKKASWDTTESQPTQLGGGVGLRVIAPTPEPFQQAPPFSYNVYEYPTQEGSQPVLKKEPSMEGSALKGKLSDPFLNKPHEHVDYAHSSTAMFNAKRASRSILPKISTVPAPVTKGSHSRHQSQNKGVPNFRSLVQPQQQQAKKTQPRCSPPPQLPNVTPFSPLSPEIPLSGSSRADTRPQTRGNDHSIMNRGRPQANPFFSSQQSQLASLRPYRTKSRRVRPETHYTTGSDTEFEDDEPSPLSPLGMTPHMAIAELPGLSPVAESPARHSNLAMRTPSPRARGSPPSQEEKTTPLSKLRYPDIPGQTESPRREVGTIPLAMAMAIPKSPRTVHVAQLHKQTPSPVNEPRHQRQRSAGSTIISPTTQILDSPIRMRSDSSPNLMPSPQQKPKLVPSPLRPAHGFHHGRQSVDDIPPPPPPKDDPAQYYPSPSTTTFSTRKFHDAARRLGSMDASTTSLGNWPVQPTRPVELPAGNPVGLGNWPVQPTRGARPVAPPRTQSNPDYEIPEQLSSPEVTFVSSTMRTVPPENIGRVIVPGPSGRMMHAPPLQSFRNDILARKAVNPVRGVDEHRAYAQAYDAREKAYRYGEAERQREFDEQQMELSRYVSDFDPSLSTAPLLPMQGGAHAPRSVMRTWGVDQTQARRELLGGGRDLHNPRGVY